MSRFMFSYGGESDDIFVYQSGKKSAGAVEMGDFVFDFDETGALIAVQILNASDVLSRLLHRTITAASIRGIHIEQVYFDGMYAMTLEVLFNAGIERIPLIIPRIHRGSPALLY